MNRPTAVEEEGPALLRKAVAYQGEARPRLSPFLGQSGGSLRLLAAFETGFLAPQDFGSLSFANAVGRRVRSGSIYGPYDLPNLSPADANRQIGVTIAIHPTDERLYNYTIMANTSGRFILDGLRDLR